MVGQKVNEATWALIGAFQETSQDIVQRIVAAQECDTKFSQSYFPELSSRSALSLSAGGRCYRSCCPAETGCR
jgi:hypothetical protein